MELGAIVENYVVIRAFYALKDPVTPLKATMIGVFIMALSGWSLKNLFQQQGLALAHSLTDISILVYLFINLGVKLKGIKITSLLVSFLKLSDAVSISDLL